MSFLLYQRSDPRHDDWLPLKAQQLRLRNLVQLIGVNLAVGDNAEIYFTLHVTPFSAPFFTSEKLKKKAGQRVHQWKEIEPEHAYYSGIKFSAKGCTVRVWVKAREEDEKCGSVLTWGVYFEGLYRLGSQNDWSSDMFERNALLFRTPFGVFTSESCIKPRPTTLTRYLVISKTLQECRPSYRCKLLASLHRKQRAIIEEVQLAIDLKAECEILAFSEAPASLPGNERRVILSSRGRKIRPGSKKAQLALKKQIEEMKFKVLSLAEEKSRAEGRLQRIKKERLGMEDMNKELVQRFDILNNERRRLQQYKLALIERRHRLSQLRSDVFLRKKQLISELSMIYPLTMIDSVKRYSINGVQLPESDYQGYEGGGQASVALGYTAHLVSMLCFFLGIPLRYPIRHFGSRSRIVDHINANMPEREREFPLYFKGKPDIFSIYGAYLLNKNIAQVRWYCGLVTQDLRATLPNLATLIHNRLAIKGWDQHLDDDSLEMAEEITEETDRILLRSENSVSLDQGLNDLRVSEDKIQNSIRGSITTLDYASNNSAAVGDVYRGRAQEKFLAGWKKCGLTPSEEIDPAWLVNSMDADQDCSRRVSTVCLSRAYHSDIESSVASNSKDHSKSRRRRFGQVSLPSTEFDGIPPAPQPSIKNRHSSPSDFAGANSSDSFVADAGRQSTNTHAGLIPDDSQEARQLRLLDRKISMYFGDRTMQSGSAVRRTKSFERIPGFNDMGVFCDERVTDFKIDADSRPEGFMQGNDLSVASQTLAPPSETQSIIMNVGVGIGNDPHFSCVLANSEVSDNETDSCDFHVSPPVEILSNKSTNHENAGKISDETKVSSENPKAPEPSTDAVEFPLVLEHSSDTGSKPVDATEEIQSKDNNDKPNTSTGEFLCFDDTKSSTTSADCDMNLDGSGVERGSSLDDEALWNRTEALMSSYQSFNLIRRSAIDPK